MPKRTSTAGSELFIVDNSDEDWKVVRYQVCEKWLKDRKGRCPTKDDLAHYQKIVAALNETIRLMKEIDERIDEHGGWPAAFVSSEKKTG